MDILLFREYCIKKKGVTEELPFGDDTLVFKIKGKIFAISGIENFNSINLKCQPEKIPELQEKYPAVKPGYHMNKKHWITVLIDNSIPDKLLKKWIDNSYNLVVKNLSKKLQNELDIKNNLK